MKQAINFGTSTLLGKGGELTANGRGRGQKDEYLADVLSERSLIKGLVNVYGNMGPEMKFSLVKIIGRPVYLKVSKPRELFKI